MPTKNCIAIGCHPGNNFWLANMIPTLGGVEYPIIFVVNEYKKAEEGWLDALHGIATSTGGSVYCVDRNGFSPGVLQTIVDNTDYENILHLHDSVEIKNLDMFRIIFEDLPLHSISLSHGFLMYMGKYRREILQRVGIPHVNKKSEEHHNEFAWTKQYIDAARPYFVELWPSWTDTDVFVEKFGQKRMVLENDYIKKYKGTWSVDMIKD